MSIVRWCRQSDGSISDVYIYWDCNGGITCHSAKNDGLDFNKETPKEVIAHLKQYFKDHNIPEFVFKEENYYGR